MPPQATDPQATGTHKVNTDAIPPRAVFFDPSGRRWRLIQIGTLLVLMLVILTAAVSWPKLQYVPTIGAPAQTLPQRYTIPSENIQQMPMIGVGPLVRVVRIEQSANQMVAVDPLTNQNLGAITGDDADTVGTSQYALQRYGYSSAAHKTIELTFDDGPDPTWTPQILDVLAKYHVQATFFVIGSEVAKYPQIVQREVREGHTVGNHTLTHPQLGLNDVGQQFGLTDRIIRGATGVHTTLARLPYDGSSGSKILNNELSQIVLEAERMKYLLSIEEFDTNDWKYGDLAIRPKAPPPFPPTTMDNVTILLHDGGGNRSETVAYLKQLIPWARAHGYKFQSLVQVSPQVMAGTSQSAPSVWDLEAFWGAEAIWSWPTKLIHLLFWLAVISVVLSGGINLVLAVGRRIRGRRRFVYLPRGAINPDVAVVIAAYNEEKVIRRTIEAICRSRYENLKEVIIVDDGSTDGTAAAVTEAAAADPRIRLLRQRNAGKAAALNYGFTQALSPIIVTLDADTVFTKDTISNLVRHFALDWREQLAAVAGVVKVGNLRNLLTRYQALEYLIQIGVDRGAQDVLHAIMVVPGACAAWRKDAVQKVGGFPLTTLAEDCDLGLALEQEGYRVTQDDDAVCYTEAPETVQALVRQRFRWMYGILQALWKHRRMIFNPRYGWLGMLVLPFAVISVLMPLIFLPFVYIMAVVLFEGQGLGLVLLYAGIFLLAQFVTAIAAIWLTHERPSHLLMVPLYRLIYEPLRAYILYKSALTVLRGTRSNWDKLQRLGTVAPSALKRKRAKIGDQARGTA
jgi:cellulose synthase/poly-beta-1,6-N-acetylglucosamine synthase-like glycosyltransferase/peptidoglycan/xylan/chitin deacetylase (PgdA/CDA1 family)